jgi:rhodanese-related sulfurtransferase
MEAHRITIEELKQRLDLGHHVMFVDTRSPESWETSDVKVPGAIRIPADKVPDHLEELPHDGTIVTYCT